MPRQEPPEDRERQIIEAAMAVFAREGFHEARMEDIAKESQLGKGTLYLYFKSKDAIIAALLRYFFNVQLKRLRAIEGGEGSVSDLLMAYTRELVSEAERLVVFSSITFEFYAIAMRDKEVRRFFGEFFSGYRAALIRVIQRGIASGEFRAVDPDEIAVTIIALLEGLNLLNTVDRSALRIRETAESGMRLLLDAIKAR
ncbi:MAG TPA: TetR/AcrR family transcriptional regulator [Ktedonobacterales bacterium]|nr:TetR/AcrR family transcriptional regulator [Ktedonobacterales bacterium]